MLRPFFVKGTQERSALGCPKRVNVQRAKNGGSGHSCRRILMVPIIPRRSTQTAAKSYPMPYNVVPSIKEMNTYEIESHPADKTQGKDEHS